MTPLAAPLLSLSLPLAFTTAEFRTDIVPPSGDFTVGCLFRLDGFQPIPERMEYRNGMVFCCESGYFDGFRLFLEDERAFRPVFEIGRPEGAVQLKPEGGLSTGLWHHVSISWEAVAPNATNGTMRLFVDGRLECESPADRPAPILKGAPLRVGYVDYGVGALAMEARHLFFESRSLSAGEVLQKARAAVDETFPPNPNPDHADPADPREMLRNCLAFAAATDVSDPGSIARHWMNRGHVMPYAEIFRTLRSVPRQKDHLDPEPLRDSDIPESHRYRIEAASGVDVSDTLAEILERIAERRRGGDTDPVHIRLSGGRHAFSHTVRLSGPEHSDILLTGEQSDSGKESTVLDGGNEIPLSAFRPVDDPAILRRLPSEEARRAVRVADVSLPRTDAPCGCGVETRHGILLGIGKPTIADDLLARMKRGEPADVSPDTPLFGTFGHRLVSAGWPDEGYAVGTATEDGLIRLADPRRVARWATAPHPMAHGYWRFLWADATLPVRVEGDALRLAVPHCYGLGPEPRLRVQNLLEELDAPGEWAAEDGRLYLIPPEGLSEDMVVQIPRLDEPFLRVENCANVTVSFLAFHRCAADGLVVTHAPRFYAHRLSFKDIGGTGMILDGCAGATLLQCGIGGTGHGGVYASAGDRDKLESGDLKIAGSVFFNIGELARTYTPAIRLEGCGNLVDGCTFSNTYSSAIRMEGNNHIVQNCRFNRTVLESDDQGTIDMWGDPTYRGNVIRGNVFQDIGGEGETDCGRAGVRFDDMISGNWVLGNTFIDSARGGMGAVVIHGGQHNRVFGNVFTNCLAGVVFNPWEADRWNQTLDGEEAQAKQRGRIDSPVYLEAYPELARLREDVNVNYVWGNLFSGSGALFRHKRACVVEYGNVRR